MKTPWNVKEEFVQYVLKSRYVSSECRLTLEEEHRLFEMCGEAELKDNEIARVMRNRKRFLIAAETRSKSKETAFAMLREIEYPKANTKSRCFHQWKDDSCVVDGTFCSSAKRENLTFVMNLHITLAHIAYITRNNTTRM